MKKIWESGTVNFICGEIMKGKIYG